MTHRFLELPRIAAGQQAGPARAALGIVREGVGKEDALARDAVEGGRLDPLAAIRTRVAERPIVGNDEKDVRAFWFRSAPCNRDLDAEQRGEQFQYMDQSSRYHSVDNVFSSVRPRRRWHHGRPFTTNSIGRRFIHWPVPSRLTIL